MVSTDPYSTDTHVSDTVHPFVKHVALPEELSWLRQMAIKLWIDQEGFRAVKSSMRLMGYSPRARSLLPYEPAKHAGSDVAAGIAEFMPTKRETFAFHYATLDGPPVLRMVSVAGDDSRDYISKQVTLSVKTNGVYTVLGTETFIAQILNSNVLASGSQNVRLRWKFDYLVSDRRVDGTQRILPGEKTLTPLTFSCSPYLFHPLQGKKAGLMHIIKKNLAPRIGSQKQEPPPCQCTSSQSILPQVSYHLSVGGLGDAVTHARSHTYASPEAGQYSLAGSLVDSGVVERTVQGAGAGRIQYPRRRRASPAGGNSLTCPRSETRPIGNAQGRMGRLHSFSMTWRLAH